MGLLSKSSRGRKGPGAGWPERSALMISLASPKKRKKKFLLPAHAPSLSLSLFSLSLSPFLPPLLPPSGALTKETWLSQRPAADLLIHSLCPFYVLLQTYLQRGRRKREEGGFEGKEDDKDLKSARVVLFGFFLASLRNN